MIFRRPTTPALRRALRLAGGLVGFAIGMVLLGRPVLATIAAGIAAMIVLSILRHLIRSGER